MNSGKNRSRHQRPGPRPLWAVVIGVGIGFFLVAFMLALGSHWHTYMIVLYSCLAGMAGGTLAALLTDRLKLASGWRIGLIGVAFGLSLYGLHAYVAYLLTQPGPETTFWDHVWHAAHNTALGRRGRTWFDIGPAVFALIAVLEIGLVTWVSASIARILHDVFRKF